MKRIGVLASSRGTNFQAIIDACAAGRIPAQPVVAISNNSKALALERARRAGIAAVHLSSATHPDPAQLDLAIRDSLVEHGVDLVVTAGYMKKLGEQTLAAFRGCIINVHPSLLPKHGGQGMYGMNVHRAVIAAGDSMTGITIHQVDADYDTGAIIGQLSIPVLATDTPETLAARVLEREHDFLINTLAELLDA